MTQIKKEDIPAILRLMASAIESGEVEATFGLIESWYNCDSIPGDAKLSIMYRLKKKGIGEWQC